MHTWQYFILFFSLVGSGTLAFFFRKNIEPLLPLFLSFSGAYIIGITALHLIPETFEHGRNMLGGWLLLGFIGQLLLENLSKGIEHGHVHISHTPSLTFVLQIMLGLSIHSFMEGMALGTSPEAAHHFHAHGHEHLFWGIILHELPASFTLISLLLSSGFQKKVVILCLIIYAAMSSFGAIFAHKNHFSEETNQIIMAIVIGTFLHISTTILFESDSSKNHHHIPYKKLFAIGVGIGIAFLSLL